MRTPQRDKSPRPHHAGSARAVETCYALMAVVTVIATGVGFWLSYAGLHAFDKSAGLTGPESWAWPSSVDLFILAGELGITISTLRDGRTDWRAWVYFAAGCGPSITFNVLHAFPHIPGWAKYAVAATPPIAAVLALAALMQQVISLPDALRHMQARQQDAPGADSKPSPGVAGAPPAAALQVRFQPAPEAAPAPLAPVATRVAADYDSGHLSGVVPGRASVPPSGEAANRGSGQSEAAVPATRPARSRRKVPATPRRISDADLKEQLRSLLEADPDVSLATAAKGLGRGRDRLRPLLEEVRSEVRSQDESAVPRLRPA